ncbi:hypothetical protein FHW58_002746 [Duganella sp. 1224]|uniref:EF-hand domain-containing protein n=1 Tax=Duganella sp. 1224 TaxID=2587052 RepID=UPI0015CC4402|nr:EF-hand domain-containing protein [Duganella sp. 1224]NYE61539.1 hypothetical protein [Duganella sp. 1224]
MAISGINSASGGYSAAPSNNDSAGAAKPAVTSTPSGDGKSSIVTLSDGSSMNVIERDASALKATPLAVLRSPEMLVAGDGNQDQQIDADEFGKQLARIGVSADDAKKLFATFDASGDGKVSPDEYIQGVKDSIASGNDLFKNLLNSYINGDDGHLDLNAYAAFMQKGKELAAQYAKQSGNER